MHDYANIAALCAGSVAAILFAIAFSRRYLSSLSDIPGPILASVSTFWQIWHVILGDTEHAVMAQHKKHGPFVRISNKEVSCSHPDSISAVLVPAHRKGDWYQALAVPDKNHNTPMSEVDPKRHRERSSITSAGYSFSYLIKSEDVIDSCIEELTGQLTQLADTGKAVDLERWLNYFSFDVIGELTFSKRFGFLKKGIDIDDSIKNVRFLMFYQTLMGYMYWLHPIILASPLAGIFGLKPHYHIFNTMHKTLDKREENLEKRKDMVSLWTANHQKHPDRMEEREIAAVAGMTTIAGSETMTAALESVFYFMIRHPEYYHKLLQELDTAESEGRLSKVVKDKEAKQLPYLQACVKETLRYFPPAPFGFPRVAGPDGITVGERHFKAGTILSVNPHVIQHHPDYFGIDATSFNPERWFRPEAPSYDKYMITFSTGYNGCPGKQFAYSEMAKVVATLMRDFEFEMADKRKEWNVKSQFTVVLKDWAVRIKARRVVV